MQEEPQNRFGWRLLRDVNGCQPATVARRCNLDLDRGVADMVVVLEPIVDLPYKRIAWMSTWHQKMD